MSRVRRTILFFSLVTVAALFGTNLYAQGKTYAQGNTGKSSTPEPCGEACPTPLDVCGEQACGTGPIWCPDDYRPKCPPRICLPTYCGTCDCYEAKCAPCIRLPKYCGSCDCYDAKCLPCLKIPCWFPSFYKCPPPKCCGSPAVKPAITKPSCR